jgi:hypothetical protein
VRVDSVLIAVPLVLYVLHRLARRDLPRREALALLLPFALLATHAAIHAAFWAHKYVLAVANRRYWSLPAWTWTLLGLLGLSTVAGVLWLGPRLARLVDAEAARLRLLAMAGIATLVLYACFLRPYLSAWAGGDGNDPALYWPEARLLPALGFRRLAAHDAQALVRFSWFVSPLGLGLGLLGLLAAIREGTRRMLFPILTVLTFSGFYFYKIRIWNDYYFALRRYVPVVLPFLMAFAAAFLCRLARRGRTARSLALAAGLTLFALYARETARIASFTDWKGSVDFVRDVSRRFAPEDVVLFEQPKSIHLVSLPLWALYGVNALEFARFNPDPETLARLVRVWRERYRNIYFVHTPRTDLCGIFLERIQPFSFGTFEWERTYDRPPRAPRFQSVHFVLSRFVAPEDLQVPPLPEVDVGGSDDVQVSGFFDKEILDGRRTYRWTGPCGSLYFPGAAAGKTLVITAAAGQRPASAPANVTVSVSGVRLGSFTAEEAFRDFRLGLPRELPPGPPVVRLDVAAWRPGDRDGRELGVMVDRVAVEGRGGEP